MNFLSAANPPLEPRREKILYALRDCVLQHGYAVTSLADIARAAGMTPSHLLYYFRGKEAIVHAYFELVASHILQTVRTFDDFEPAVQIDLICELFLGDEKLSKGDVGFVFEFFGLSVHNKDMHRIKSRFDREIKDWFTRLFAKSGPRTQANEDLGEIAYAVLTGLLNASFFDERMSLERTKSLFHMSLRTMLGSATVPRAPT